MRLRLTLEGTRGTVVLPIHYNHLLQAVIYARLDEHIAARLHNSGAKDPHTSRRLKLFAFSRLLPVGRFTIQPRTEEITFASPVQWIVTAPLKEFIVSLYNHLLPGSVVVIDGAELQVKSVWVDRPPAYKHSVRVVTLSPVTVYRTSHEEGSRYTAYLSPENPDFSQMLVENLRKKYRALSGKDILVGKDAWISPHVDSMREHVVRFKDTIVKGWTGVFTLSLPEELYHIAFSCGLGAKNSQGFGCIDVWRGGANV